MERLEAEVEHEGGGFGGVALAPVSSADGVAEFGAVVAAESEADESDEDVVGVGHGQVVIGAGIRLRAGDVACQALRLIASVARVEAERFCDLRVADDGHGRIQVLGPKLAQVDPLSRDRYWVHVGNVSGVNRQRLRR